MKISKRRFFPLCLCLMLSGCISAGRLYYIAPTLLPGTEIEMNSAGFWISRHPFPDRVILDTEEIESLNSFIQEELKLKENILEHPSRISGVKVISFLENVLNYFSKKSLYTSDGRKVKPFFYRKMQKNMNLTGIPSEISVQFGIVTSYANQRIFPTNDGLYAKRKDIDFDELQNSALDTGTPMVILHKSLNGKWYYARSPLSSGWVEVEKIAICGLEELSSFIQHPDFVVITSSKGDIFLNSALSEYYGYARMGVKLPLKEKVNSEIYKIIVPFRKNDGTFQPRIGYVKKTEVSEGYLPYTARNVITQAFKLLNAPYGWGGMYGEQDCSRFVQEIFATVGIMFPRNSSAQGKVGILSGSFDKKTSEEERLKILSEKAIGGITLLRLRGHIILFLGTVNGFPYAIHETCAYRERTWRGNIIRVINKVVVTDLSLGKGSRKGSLLERIITVRIVKGEGQRAKGER